MASSRAALLAALAASWPVGCSDSRPAEWGYISPIIMQPNCATASCHSRAAAVSGLDFSDPDRGYKSLTTLWVWVSNPNATDKQTLPCGTAGKGVPVCEEHFRPLVTPYVPSESRLVNVLRARGATRMPPDRPLSEADIRLVEQWILDGARWNGSPASTTVDAGAGDGSRDAATKGGADGSPADGTTDAHGADGNADGLDGKADGLRDGSVDGGAG